MNIPRTNPYVSLASLPTISDEARAATAVEMLGLAYHLIEQAIFNIDRCSTSRADSERIHVVLGDAPERLVRAYEVARQIRAKKQAPRDKRERKGGKS